LVQLGLDGDGNRPRSGGQRNLLEHRLGDLVLAHDHEARAILAQALHLGLGMGAPQNYVGDRRDDQWSFHERRPSQ
jgi:hypothetical protein